MKLKHVVLCLIILLTLTGCFSKEMYIRDNKNQPISGANIQIMIENVAPKVTKISDENGYATVNTIFRLHSVKISKSGYQDIYITKRKLLDIQPLIINLNPMYNTNKLKKPNKSL